jgi:hypothetical protein
LNHHQANRLPCWNVSDRFREQDRATAPWHYIDICLQDSERDVPARCPQGNCVTAKIDEYGRRLRDGDYDKWGAADDLAFLIHFVCDIHQPLHTTTNADRGGTCQQVNVAPAEENLHFATAMSWRESTRVPSRSHKIVVINALNSRQVTPSHECTAPLPINDLHSYH